MAGREDSREAVEHLRQRKRLVGGDAAIGDRGGDCADRAGEVALLGDRALPADHAVRPRCARDKSAPPPDRHPMPSRWLFAPAPRPARRAAAPPLACLRETTLWGARPDCPNSPCGIFRPARARRSIRHRASGCHPHRQNRLFRLFLVADYQATHSLRPYQAAPVRRRHRCGDYDAIMVILESSILSCSMITKSIGDGAC